MFCRGHVAMVTIDQVPAELQPGLRSELRITKREIETRAQDIY